MPPKGKGGDKGGAAKGKGKGKPAEEKEEKGGKVKGAQFVNVRHILVCNSRSSIRKRGEGLMGGSARNMRRRKRPLRS